MSLLMAAAVTGGAIVYTDTLATTLDGTPYALMDKCHPVAHANILIAGTGLGAIVERWATLIRGGRFGADLDEISIHAPDVLRHLYDTAHSDDDDLRANPKPVSVYHLGQGRDGRFRTDIFRSYTATPFTRDTRAAGVASIKPDLRDPTGTTIPVTWPTTDTEAVELAERIRAAQQQRPFTERIHIGGDLIRYTLTDNGITAARIHHLAAAVASHEGRHVVWHPGTHHRQPFESE